MGPLLLVLLLALLLFGAGFAVKALWWIAIFVLVVWLIGFVARGRTPPAAVTAGTAGDAASPWGAVVVGRFGRGAPRVRPARVCPAPGHHPPGRPHHSWNDGQTNGADVRTVRKS